METIFSVQTSKILNQTNQCLKVVLVLLKLRLEFNNTEQGFIFE
jgi:hypothetical protein